LKFKYKFTLENVLMDFIITVVMVIITMVTFYPFLYILFYSLSSPGTIGTRLLIWPRGFNVNAYSLMLRNISEIPRAFFISVSRTVLGSFLSLFVTSMGAYVMTRRELLFRPFISKYITITMYFSSGMIPMYVLMNNLRLSGTFWVYIIPSLFGVFNMILIRTYIENMPAGLEESAVIDGANDYVLYFRIVLPVIIPVLAAVLLFSCVGHWNAYMDTMLYNAENRRLHTLQYVLMVFVQTNTASLEQARRAQNLTVINANTLKMALTIVTIIPILLIYPALQKHFAAGIMIGSIKG